VPAELAALHFLGLSVNAARRVVVALAQIPAAHRALNILGRRRCATAGAFRFQQCLSAKQSWEKLHQDHLSGWWVGGSERGFRQLGHGRPVVTVYPGLPVWHTR